MRSLLRAGLLCTLGLGGSALPAAAITITVTGTAGLSGPDGANTNPGGDGGAGSDGGAASAVAAEPADATNVATARGGAGGRGGSGGDASSAGSAGGDAGAAGDGGNAGATATSTTGEAQATADARGGNAGVAGITGSPGPGGQPGLGAAPGAAGSATASATASSATHAVIATSSATGGFGGSQRIVDPSNSGNGPGTDGGDATSTSDASSTVAATRNVQSTSIATAGAGGFGILGDGGNGGHASASAVASHVGGGGQTWAEARATGGDGGLALSPSAASGDAGTASASASAIGVGDLVAIVEQTGGDGGLTLFNGTDVHNGIGAASHLLDAVTATPAASHVLSQIARGGNGSPGGDASSRLSAANPAGSLRATVLAFGGGNAGGADASLVASSNGRLDAEVRAIGGTATIGVDGSADASLAAVSGGAVAAEVSATGGAATVSAEATSTSASNVDLAVGVEGEAVSVGPIVGTSAGGDVNVELVVTRVRAPSSLELENAIAVNTTGNILLRQAATAPSGAQVLDPGDPVEPGGDARSWQTLDGSAASISLVSEATGGRSSSRSTAGQGADGGDANARADVRNATGSAHAATFATGGQVGFFFDPHTSGDGGDAVAFTRAVSVATGQAVSASGNAQGGGGILTSGSASSESIGVAEGGGAVSVSDEAEGNGCQREDPLVCVAGNGQSRATGESMGGGTVNVVSLANGGRNGESGGAADALATARSLGDASAAATASGKIPGGTTQADASAFSLEGGPNGSASATAQSTGDLATAESIAFSLASGATGSASATARSAGDFDVTGIERTAVVGVLASASRSGAGSKEAEARTSPGAALPPPSVALGLEAIAHASIEPTPAVAAEALIGNPNAAASITLGAETTLIALGVLGGGAPDDGGAETITSSSFIDLDIVLGEVGVLDDLQLAFLDVAAVGTGFESLRLQIEEEGLLILNQTFTELAAALAFFDDHALSLLSPNPSQTTILDLRIQLDVTTTGPGQRFATNFLVAFVPEPSMACLLALAAGTLLALRR